MGHRPFTIHKCRCSAITAVGRSSLGLIALSSAVLLASAATAQAVPRPGTSHIALKASPFCNKVSAAAVSHIVGFTVPAGVGYTNRTLFDKALNISASVTSCLYGTVTTSGSMTHVIGLTYETLSRPITLADIKRDLASNNVQGTMKATITSYNGLGEPGFLVTFSGPVVGKSIFGINGKKIAGSAEFNLASVSQVAALAKLAIAAS